VCASCRPSRLQSRAYPTERVLRKALPAKHQRGKAAIRPLDSISRPSSLLRQGVSKKRVEQGPTIALGVVRRWRPSPSSSLPCSPRPPALQAAEGYAEAAVGTTTPLAGAGERLHLKCSPRLLARSDRLSKQVQEHEAQLVPQLLQVLCGTSTQVKTGTTMKTPMVSRPSPRSKKHVETDGLAVPLFEKSARIDRCSSRGMMRRLLQQGKRRKTWGHRWLERSVERLLKQRRRRKELRIRRS
jgi:hypothetical protein